MQERKDWVSRTGWCSRWLSFAGALTLGTMLVSFLGSLKIASASAREVTAVNPWLVSQLPAPETVDAQMQLNWFRAVVLGAVQGLTEFLPISSTAHLKAVPVALGWGDPGVTFTAVIQLGSIAAVIWYFWEDLANVVGGAVRAIRKSDYQSQDFRLAVGISLGTIPIAVCGLLMKVLVPDLDNSPLRSMTTIAIVSIVMALLLALSEFVGTHKRNFEQLGWLDGVLMGLAQTLALVPGVSRSGSTLTAGLFMGLERATAARFSFLLGVPAITLAGLVELLGVFEEGWSSADTVPLIVAVISSAVFSYLAIAWLIRFLQRNKTWVFVWYRLGFGLLILAAIALGRL